MRLTVLAVNLKQSNFVSLFVVYILISVFSVVCCENVTSNAINSLPMAAAAAAVATNSTHSSASLASAAGINKTNAFRIGGGADASTITIATNAVQPSLAAATATSQVQQKLGSQQKSTPLQRQQQQRQEKLQQQQRAKGIQAAHGN